MYRFEKLLIGGCFTSIYLLLICYVIHFRSISTYFISAVDFITSLPLVYYIGYYGTITLIAIYALNWDRMRSSVPYHLLLLLLLALYMEFPRYVFTYPFQREVFHQAQIIHVATYGTISGIPPHKMNVANPIFWSIFIEITAVKPLLVVLYFAPTFMWLVTVMFLFTIVRSLSRNDYISLISTFFFQSSFFELFFASRYAYASPLFVLFIGLLMKLLIKPARSVIYPLALLTLTIVVAHIGFSTLALVTTIAVACLTTWCCYKLHESSINKCELIHAQDIAIFFFIAYGLWYFVLGRFQGINIWLHAVISALREGFSRLRLVEAVYRLPLEPVYELIVNVRIAIALFTILFLLALIAFQVFRNGVYKILHLGLAVTYILYLLPLSIGVIEGIWSLRPFHIMMLFSPILIAFLLPRRLFKFLIALSLLFSSIIIYVLWIPNLGYIQVPDEKVKLIEYVSTYIPQNQVLGVLGMSPVERSLLTHIFSNREDLKIVSIGHVLSHDWEHLKIPNVRYVLVDSSIEKYEVKYVCIPSIRERIRLLITALTNNYYFNKVYDSSSLYALLYK